MIFMEVTEHGSVLNDYVDIALNNRGNIYKTNPQF